MEQQERMPPVQYFLEVHDLRALFDSLMKRGYKVIGPTAADGSIILAELESPDDLPIGWKISQSDGSCKLEKRTDGAYFGYVTGLHNWKRFLNPPAIKLWSAERKGPGFQVTFGHGEVPRYAFLGVRPCDVAAIKIQDKILTGGNYKDSAYASIREKALVITVNCMFPEPTCFCKSLNTGPVAAGDFDIALTEVISNDRQYFLAETGSERAVEILSEIQLRHAKSDELKEARNLLEAAEKNITRSVKTDGIKEMLFDSFDHQRWDHVAKRCLNCGNCTMVCPTCFCESMVDSSSLDGMFTSRSRSWDSCFSVDLSYIHGGSTRPTPKSRYRHWLTHKFAGWQDQFGSIGCVGCGRCITWCPVGIDITEEINEISGAEMLCPTCVPSKDKSLETLKRLLRDHPFIREIGENYLDIVALNASIVRFNAGELIVHTGDNAERFYLILHGSVSIETYTPERGTLIVQTIGENDLLGWSWFIAPYRWVFDAHAVELTRAIAVDARRIRELCEKDIDLSYKITKYLSQIIGQRMEATRMQLLDISVGRS